MFGSVVAAARRSIHPVSMKAEAQSIRLGVLPTRRRDSAIAVKTSEPHASRLSLVSAWRDDGGYAALGPLCHASVRMGRAQVRGASQPGPDSLLCPRGRQGGPAIPWGGLRPRQGGGCRAVRRGAGAKAPGEATAAAGGSPAPVALAQPSAAAPAALSTATVSRRPAPAVPIPLTKMS